MLTAQQARNKAKHFTAYVDGWQWPNFSPRELACKGTDLLYVNEHAINMLVQLRAMLGGKPIMLNSAYRTPEHNFSARVKGSKNSHHMLCQAFDVDMRNHDPVEFERAALAVGFRGIKRYPERGFMHIDARQGPIWVAGNKWPTNVGEFTATPEIPPAKRTEQGKGAAVGAASTGIIGTILAAVTTASDTLFTYWYQFSGLLSTDFGLGFSLVKLIGLIILCAAAYFAYRYFWADSDGEAQKLYYTDTIDDAHSNVIFVRAEQGDDGTPTLAIYAADETVIQVVPHGKSSPFSDDDNP